MRGLPVLLVMLVPACSVADGSGLDMPTDPAQAETAASMLGKWVLEAADGIALPAIVHPSYPCTAGSPLRGPIIVRAGTISLTDTTATATRNSPNATAEWRIFITQDCGPLHLQGWYWLSGYAVEGSTISFVIPVGARQNPTRDGVIEGDRFHITYDASQHTPPAHWPAVRFTFRR